MGCGSSCGSCGTVAEGGVPKGCRSNGSCRTSGCNKLDVFDWLGDMGLPQDQLFPIVEVRFKGNHKGFYRVPEGLEVITGQAVVVDVPNGHHLGHVSLQGELVRLQMRKKKIKDTDENIRRIYRIATAKDLEMFKEVKARENPTMYRARQIIQEMGLKMKLSDVEYQSDNIKATFYYSADERVDFRELIKLLASEFRIRVEMRQISLRQEAGRLGGIGSCGRELCCSTWLTDFKSVTTVAARYQNLSLNPSKLSGQCGRLKCCLNYELQTYMDALNDIPKLEKPIETQKGKLTLQKTDIFRKIMWFSYEKENTWIPVSVGRVNEIIELNAQNIKPEILLKENANPVEILPDWQNDLSLEEGAIPQEKQNKRTRKRRPNRHKRPNPTAEPQNTESQKNVVSNTNSEGQESAPKNQPNHSENANSNSAQRPNPRRNTRKSPQRPNNQQPKDNRNRQNTNPNADPNSTRNNNQKPNQPKRFNKNQNSKTDGNHKPNPKPRRQGGKRPHPNPKNNPPNQDKQE